MKKTDSAWLVLPLVLVSSLARADGVSAGIEAGVLVRPEAAGDALPHPWLGLRGEFEINHWVRVAAAYGVSYGREGNELISTFTQHRVSLIPEMTIRLGAPRVFLGVGVLGQVRNASFEEAGLGFADTIQTQGGPAASAGVEVDLPSSHLRIRFGTNAALAGGRIDVLFTVGVEHLFGEVFQ